MLRKLFPAAALLLASAIPAHAAARHPIGMQSGAPADITVTDLSEETQNRAKPVRVLIENNAAYPVSYDATLKLSDGRSVTRTITVPASAARTADITAPATLGGQSGGWYNTEVSIDGPGTTSSSRAYLSRTYSGRSFSTERQFALSSGLHADFANRLKKAYETFGTGAAYSELDPHSASPDWRTLRGFDAVILSGDDWRIIAARPESREAALRYVAQGGRIRIITTKDENPPALPGAGDRQTLGFGRITVFRTPGENAVKAIETSSSAATDGNNPFSTLTLWPGNDIRTNASYRSLDKLLPATAKAGIIVGVIIIAFAVLVGPVNLFVFCRGPRRHRMLWLTPLIAMGTSVLLSGYIFVADGVGGEGHRRRLRMRPAGANSEFLVQEQSSRTGLLLGTSFDIPADALLWNLPDSGTNPAYGFSGRNADNFREINGRGAGDWFKSRYAQAQCLEMWDAARGGLALSGATTAPELLNTFDGTLDRVFLRTGDGTLWFAEKVAPGAKVSPRKATDAEFRLWKAEVARTSGYTQNVRLNDVFDRKNWYYAESSNLRAASPETLDSIRWNNLPDVIVGDLATDNKGTAQ